MLRRLTAKSEKQRRKIRFPGIVAHAEKLGVNRSHLYRVLTGERPSPSLFERFQALQGGNVAHE